MKKILAILVIVLLTVSFAQAGKWFIDDLVLESSTVHAPQTKKSYDDEWKWTDLKFYNGLRWGFYPDSNLYEGELLTVSFESEFYFEQKFETTNIDGGAWDWDHWDNNWHAGTSWVNTYFTKGMMFPINIKFKVQGKFAPKFIVAGIWTTRPWIYVDLRAQLNAGLTHISASAQWENNIDIVKNYVQLRPDFFLWMGMPAGMTAGNNKADISTIYSLTVCSPDWNEWMPERGRIIDTGTKFALRQQVKMSFLPNRYKDTIPGEVAYNGGTFWTHYPANGSNQTMLDYTSYHTFLRIQQEVLQFAGVDSNIELEIFAEEKVDVYKPYDAAIRERDTVIMTWGQYGLTFKAYGFFTGLYFIYDTQDAYNSANKPGKNAVADADWTAWRWENGERGEDYWDYAVKDGQNGEPFLGRGRAGVQLELGYENGEMKVWTKYQGRHRIRDWDNLGTGLTQIGDMWRNDFEFGVRFKW